MSIKILSPCYRRMSETQIANKWAEFRNPPRTIQEAFDLATRIQTQIQVADSFRIELTNDFPSADINEISAGKTSSDKF